jgi:hypothetical protein
MSDRHDDELNRFWNELAERGQSAAPNLDAGDAMLVRRLQSLAATPLPGAARERVWRGLLDTWQPTTEGKEPPMNTATSPTAAASLHANGRKATRPVPIASRRLPVGLGRPILRYAAAAILVLGIIISFDAFRASRTDHGNQPAILAPASPEPTDETVLESTIPADAVPAGGFEYSALALFTVPVGNRSTWEVSCCQGPLIEHVVSGTYTIRAAAAVHVVREDGSTEDVPANTEVTLSPGDSVISRNEVTVEGANTGAEPIVLLNFFAIENDEPQFNLHQLPGWIAGSPDIAKPLVFQPGPIAVRLRKTTVMNGESVAAPSSGYQFAGTPVKGTYIAEHSDGSIQVFGQVGQPVEAYILTLTQAGDSGGTPSP